MDKILHTYNFSENFNNTIKNSIINAIYQELNINNFRYDMLDYNMMDLLKKDTYYITPHIIGSNCWIIYIEIKSVEYQVILYKKDLKPYRNQMNVNYIKIYNIEYVNKPNNNTIKSLYPLTILEGKFILNSNDIINKPSFLIHDMYIYNGQKILTKNLPDKVKLIESLLPQMNTGLDPKFNIKLAGIYTYEQMGDLVFNKIRASKLKINGLIFLPEKSGKIYLYINDNDFNMLKNGSPSEQICKEYSSLSIPSIPLQMSVNNQLDKHLIDYFVFRKTNIADVFELYKYINKEKTYLNLTNENYIGICHIPNIKASHYCKSMSDKHDIFVNKCNYNYKYKKWTVIID